MKTAFIVLLFFIGIVNAVVSSTLHRIEKRDESSPGTPLKSKLPYPYSSILDHVKGSIANLESKLSQKKEDDAEKHEVKRNIYTKLKRILSSFIEKLRRDNSDSNEDKPKTEMGTLAGTGRDIIKGISGGLGKTGRVISNNFGKVQNSLHKIAHKHPAGLDLNSTVSLSDFKLNVDAIFPGTKWCGDGDVAKSDSDLGLFDETDACCREHDKCPDNIAAGDTKHGLLNNGLFTRSHCDCDEKFYNCLERATNPVASSIGFTYFTILGPQCFEKEYPIIKCKEYETKTSILKKCVSYELDENAEQIYQWFDNPLFF